MACCHHYLPEEGGESTFAVEAAAITFGPGCLTEAGAQAALLGLTRVALFTDKRLAALAPVARIEASLKRASVDFELYDEARIEPTDLSFQAATRFACEGSFDGYISVGGGSVIDTAKAANLYATYPAEFLTYVNAPVGAGQPVPGPLKPHIACPTTCGTGSECTGIAIFDLLAIAAKTGIASKRLRPTLAMIDPETTSSLPANVVAASGFDVLSHALESYTARPFTKRTKPGSPETRPMSQGANPWSDLGCREALRLAGLYLERAVADANDCEARHQLMWAATLAGIAFGNSGVHLPHGMAYSVAGLVKEFFPGGYPDDDPLVPHGMSVIVNAPAVFRATAETSPARHLEAAGLLGGEVRDCGEAEAGEALVVRLIAMMRATSMPNGVSGIGYGAGDIAALTAGAIQQKRLLDNAPIASDATVLDDLYRAALSYW